MGLSIMKDVAVYSEKEIEILKQDGQLYVTSLEVAECFEKEHGKVIRSIENLECSQMFRQANFGLSSYVNKQGRKMPMYLITRDGFTMLAMGFTGKKAVAWKERFIEAFNAMEHQLSVSKQFDFDAQAILQNLDNCMKMLSQHSVEHSVSLNETKEKVNSLDDRVGRIETNIVSITSRQRRNITKKSKTAHLKAIEKYFHGQCPLCCDRKILEGARFSGEFDHFNGPSWRNLTETWPICKDCHCQLTHGHLSRAGHVLVMFQAYQARVKQLDSSGQKDLFSEKEGARS